MTQAQPRSQYPTFEAGVYEGITHVEFFSKDAGGNPIFKAKERRGVIEKVAYYRCYIGDVPGPPGSISPGDVSLLVYAFNADPAQLPDQADRGFLSTAEQLIADAGTTISVYAHKAPSAESAWVRTIYGAHLPADQSFLFSFAGVTSRKDGVPIWYDGDYGNYARVGLTVWANGDGSATHFAGATQTLYINRPAMTILRAILGTTMTALLGPPEGELAILEEMALNENSSRVIFADIVTKANNKGTTIDKTTLLAVDPNGPFPGAVYAPVTPSPAAPVAARPMPTAPAQPTPAAPVVPPGHYTPAMSALRAVIAGGTKADLDREAYDAGGNITDAGKTWCRDHLKPVSVAQSLPNKFADMTDDVSISYVLGLGRKDLLVKMGILTDDDAEEGDWA